VGLFLQPWNPHGAVESRHSGTGLTRDVLEKQLLNKCCCFVLIRASFCNSSTCKLHNVDKSRTSTVKHA